MDKPPEGDCLDIAIGGLCADYLEHCKTTCSFFKMAKKIEERELKTTVQTLNDTVKELSNEVVTLKENVESSIKKI